MFSLVFQYSLPLHFQLFFYFKLCISLNAYFHVVSTTCHYFTPTPPRFHYSKLSLTYQSARLQNKQYRPLSTQRHQASNTPQEWPRFLPGELASQSMSVVVLTQTDSGWPLRRKWRVCPRSWMLLRRSSRHSKKSSCWWRVRDEILPPGHMFRSWWSLEFSQGCHFIALCLKEILEVDEFSSGEGGWQLVVEGVYFAVSCP